MSSEHALCLFEVEYVHDRGSNQPLEVARQSGRKQRPRHIDLLVASKRRFDKLDRHAVARIAKTYVTGFCLESRWCMQVHNCNATCSVVSTIPKHQIGTPLSLAATAAKYVPCEA